MKEFLNNIQRKVENAIQKDKLMHFIGGLLLSYAMFYSFWCILIPLSFGLLKELADKYIRKGKFDMKDIFATYLGIIPNSIVIFVQYIYG